MANKIMPHHIQQPMNQPFVQPKKVPKTAETSFQSILNDELDGPAKLKISKHAEKRLEERGIEVSSEMWDGIYERVKEAKGKGVNDSLVLTNDAAFVVSADNETVITAMDREEAGTQIFTNINGAIVLDQ